MTCFTCASASDSPGGNRDSALSTWSCRETLGRYKLKDSVQYLTPISQQNGQTIGSFSSVSAPIVQTLGIFVRISTDSEIGIIIEVCNDSGFGDPGPERSGTGPIPARCSQGAGDLGLLLARSLRHLRGFRARHPGLQRKFRVGPNGGRASFHRPRRPFSERAGSPDSRGLAAAAR